MRLLKCSPAGDLSLTSFGDNDETPPYAILSHTWIDGQEVTHQELVNKTADNKAGYDKIRFCLEQATKDGLEYSWVDTCCIDKLTSEELNTAINSMFRWYQQAAKCYVLLSDVVVPEECNDAEIYRITWEESFRKSRWFKRGWTLQELLAPATVEFFSKCKKRLGSKISLEQEIHEITKIPVTALRQRRLSDFSAEERMRWTEGRMTSRKEDRVYCLLGIFGVSLPLIYGEGEEHALKRLQEEIRRQQHGQDESNVQDILATSPLPFPRNFLFTGREDEMNTLKESLLDTGGHRRMSICGLGGCGKSTVALELAYRAMDYGAVRMVFWVPAMNQQSFETAFVAIGEQLRIPSIKEDKADVMKLVQMELEQAQMHPWLMIVDNADNPDVLLQRAEVGASRLYDYLPRSANGKILFTTRSRKAAESLIAGSVLELPELDLGQAKQMLKRRITKTPLLGDDEVVVELLKELTCLPLAIVQASAFINNNDVSISEYLSLLRDTATQAELFREQFDDLARYPEMDSTVAKTWYVSFQHILHFDALAADFLSFMACINRINIPQSLLPPVDSRLRLVKAIGTLKAYAFITECAFSTERKTNPQHPKSDKFFDMHRLVHLASRWWLEEQDQWKLHAAKAAARLMDLLPDRGDPIPRGKYLPHAIHIAYEIGELDRPTKASLLDQVGRYLYNLGQFAAAIVILRQAIEVWRSVLGANQLRTLKSVDVLAVALSRQGRYEESVAMHRQVLAQQNSLLGPSHTDTLRSMNSLTAVLTSQGKNEEAEAVLRQALAQSKTALGSSHEYTLISMHNLAGVLLNQRKYKEVAATYQELSAHYKRVPHMEARYKQQMMSNLSIALSRLGKHEEAEAIHREIFAHRHRALGGSHPDTLKSMGDIATAMFNQRRYEEAEAVTKDTLAQRQRVLGASHPETMKSMATLAMVLGRQEKHKEAESLSRQTLAQQETVLGPLHPDTLSSVYALAYWLAKLRQYDEAGTLYQRALLGYTSVLGADSPYTKGCRANYTKMLSARDTPLSPELP